jgi:hypothetical protein
MLHGFEEEGFTSGVPMVPKPKSEAWIIAGFERVGRPVVAGPILKTSAAVNRAPRDRELKKILGEYP